MDKIRNHFEDIGLKSSVSENKLDFEDDYKEARLLGSESGIGNLGTINVYDSPIDYINVLKKQELVKCNFTFGGNVGLGLHLHSWLKFRFFLAFEDSLVIGPLSMGTLTTIKKGLFKSEVEEFVWSGYRKLTTLPPGLILDNVAEFLDRDKDLQQLMMKCLVKERTIFVSRYGTNPQSKSTPSNSKIVIESNWKLQKDAFLDSDTMKMYTLLSQIIRRTIENLKYHLK